MNAMSKSFILGVIYFFPTIVWADNSAHSFINLTFDGIGLVGKPYIFWPLLSLTIFLAWKSTVYVKVYYVLLLCDLFLAFWLLHNTPFVWLQDYVLWFERVFTVVNLKNIDIDIKVFIAVVYITIPIKLYLFIKYVQGSPVFIREFLISPLRKYKTSEIGDFLFSELDESEREKLEQHSYLKMILYLIVLVVSSLVFLMMITWAANANFIQPQTEGGMALWFEWNLTRILFFVIFTGTLYLMLKDWIIFLPTLMFKLWSNFLLLKENVINLYLNLKNRDN